MNLFGHHVARLSVMLAALDGGLFMLVLHLLGGLGRCQACYIGSVVHLQLYQLLVMTAVFLLITASVGLYNTSVSQDFRTFLKRFLLAWQLLFLPSVILMAFSKAAVGAPFGWFIGVTSLAISIFMLVLFCMHMVLGWCFDLPFMKKRILVFGDGESARSVASYINGHGRSRFCYVETVSQWRAIHGPSVRIGNLAVKAPEEEPFPLSAMALMLQADEIVVAVDDKTNLPVSELLDCKLSGVEVVDAVTFWEREAGRVDPSDLGANWLTFSGGFTCDQRRRAIKRVLDWTISLILLTIALPIGVVTAALIKLESNGPVFYRQERVGLNGKVFSLWKFRSMRADAERDGIPQWARSVDNRVTFVGRFIRKVRIDEIPQIINVLAGDMSFIGPRPERPFFVAQLSEQIPHYDLRHRVRPGITGWAQVNYPYGASIDDARQKLTYDLYYLKKNDLLLDLAILVQTVRVILFADGAR